MERIRELYHQVSPGMRGYPLDYITFALIASSSGFEAIVDENGLLATVNASRRSINKYIFFGRAPRDVVSLLVWKCALVADK